MMFYFAIILLTCQSFIGGLRALGCDGTVFGSQEPVEAVCARSKTCDIERPFGKMPLCEVLYGQDCRLKGSGLASSPNDVTANSQSPPLVVLSKLEVSIVELEMKCGPPMSLYSFYLEMAVSFDDLDKKHVTGIKLEFQSTGDPNYNTQYETIPVCRYFSLSQGNKSQEVGFSKEDNKDSPIQSEMVFIRHSCFGVDVLPGDFIISLTSFPGSLNSLEYRVKWLQPFYDDYDSYQQSNAVWSDQVLGVAKEKGTNRIHVVIQRPGIEHAVIWFELRKAMNKDEIVQIIKIASSESTAVFSQVPQGFYIVRVSLKGHSCELDGSCPPFESDEIYVETPLEEEDDNQISSSVETVAFPGNDDSSFPGIFYATVPVTSILLVCAMCVIGKCIIYCRKRAKWRNSKPKELPSLLLINLERGRYKDETVGHLGESIQELLKLQTHTIELSAGDKGLKTVDNGDESEICDIVRSHVLEKSPSKVNSANLKKLRRKLKPYPVIVFVSFIPDVENQSESSQEMSKKNECNDLIDIIMTSTKCKLGFVKFCKSSEHSLAFLASTQKSTQSDSTDDSVSTGLIRATDKRNKWKNKKTPSTKTLRRCKLEEINNNIIINNNKDTSIPQVFCLPSEVETFLEWLNSCYLYDSISPPTLHKIQQSQNWQATLTCCHGALLNGGNELPPTLCSHDNRSSVCLTIRTERATALSSHDNLSSECLTIRTEDTSAFCSSQFINVCDVTLIGPPACIEIAETASDTSRTTEGSAVSLNGSLLDMDNVLETVIHVNDNGNDSVNSMDMYIYSD